MVSRPDLWSVPVHLDEIPPEGRHVDLEANAGVRAAIARAAQLVELPRLTAAFDVRRLGASGVRVDGVVRATVVQICVVTLEPVTNEIDEPVALTFTSDAAAEESGAAGVMDEDGDAPEPPEALVNGAVDLGAIAVEFLLVGIDPYPRKPDAVFAAPASGDATPVSPFAALAALKKGARNQ